MRTNRFELEARFEFQTDGDISPNAPYSYLRQKLPEDWKKRFVETLEHVTINSPNAKISLMGYQQSRGSPRNSGRGRGIPRHEKAKIKKRERHSRARLLSLEEGQAQTQEEILNKTLNSLSHLGNQRFVVSPFGEQLNFWLTNLKNVLLEFESNMGTASDEHFMREKSQVISDVELKLKKRIDKEAHVEETARNLSINKKALEEIEKDHRAALDTIRKNEETEVNARSADVENAKAEVSRISQIKTGFFRGISKNGKAQKETEAKQRLEVAEKRLAETLDSFNIQREKTRTEYGEKELAVSNQIEENEKMVTSQETDDSLEARHSACGALAKTIDSFLQRRSLTEK